MASTFGWGDKKLVADITRLSTGYAQESVDKLAAVMDKYKGLAVKMQAELGASGMSMSDAEANYCFSTALFTSSMTDQCAGQKKCLGMLRELKKVKLKEFEAAASQDEKDARSSDLDEIEFLYCGIHMGVNLAVGFDGFFKSHSKSLGSVCANVEDEEEEEGDSEQVYEVEALLGSRKVAHGASDGDVTGESVEYLVKWVGFGHEENTWEPEAHVQVGSKELVVEHQGAVLAQGPAKAKAKAALKRASSKVQQCVYEVGKLLCCQSGKGLKEDQKGEAFMVWLAQQQDISDELKKLHLAMKPVIGSRCP